MTRLNPLLSVGGHLLDTLRAHRPERDANWQRSRALDLLEKVGIGAQRFRAYPHELSGGCASAWPLPWPSRSNHLS